MCTNFISIETRVTRRRVFAQLDHEFERGDPFRTVDCWFSGCVEHLAAEGPEDRHEVGDCGVALSRAHHVTVDRLTVRACTFFLLDCFGGRQNVVPGGRRFQTMFLKEIFAIEEQLRVTDVGKRVECPVS